MINKFESNWGRGPGGSPVGDPQPRPGEPPGQETLASCNTPCYTKSCDPYDESEDLGTRPPRPSSGPAGVGSVRSWRWVGCGGSMWRPLPGGEVWQCQSWPRSPCPPGRGLRLHGGLASQHGPTVCSWRRPRLRQTRVNPAGAGRLGRPQVPAPALPAPSFTSSTLDLSFQPLLELCSQDRQPRPRPGSAAASAATSSSRSAGPHLTPARRAILRVVCTATTTPTGGRDRAPTPKARARGASLRQCTGCAPTARACAMARARAEAPRQTPRPPRGPQRGPEPCTTSTAILSRSGRSHHVLPLILAIERPYIHTSSFLISYYF
jgi:hypothetical protein